MTEGHSEAPGIGGPRDLHRVTVTEAARTLGVTESAVRKRVQRGHIPHDKEKNGRVYVYLDPNESQPLSGNVPQGHASRSRQPGPGQSRDSYVRTLEERVGFLEEQVRRQTDIIAGLVQRVPELKAPAAQEPREAPQTNTEDAGGSEPRPATEEAQGPAERRSWLHRFFFGG